MNYMPPRLYPTTRALALGARWFPLLSSAIIAIVALLPRVLSLGRFITVDEAHYWNKRSAAFLLAISSGDLAATAITVHPGVTTTWLGSAGLLLHRALLALGLLPTDSFATRLALLQLPAALAHTAGVVLGYALLRRLLPSAIALLAALLWATDPLLIGYSRVLHVDALAATFLTLSLLAACLYWHHHAGTKLLALSAVCASLAVLSKSPALILVPLVAMVAVLAEHSSIQTFNRSKVARLWSLVASLLLWGGIFALTSLLLWPALLVAPARVLQLLSLGVSAEGAQPHQYGNFFLGQRFLDGDPGLRFYPVALTLRATPWMLLGVLLLPLAFGQLAPPTRHDLLALAGFVIGFSLTMDLFPKKFDRYLLPAFPALDILAAIGLQGALRALHRELPRRLQIGSAMLASGLLSGLLGVAAVLNVAAWHPYEIGAFNQLLGGARVGAATFMVGWGEGLEQAAAWLNAQPDITGVTVATVRTEPLQAYLRQGALAIAPSETGFAAHTGYAVVYLSDVQGGEPLAPFDLLYGRAPPAHEVVIHGITYAWIYQLPPPVTHRVAVQFGSGLRLRGYALDGAPEAGKHVTLTLSWATSANPPSDVALFVHVLGREGKRVAQADPVLPVEAWGPNRFFATPIPLALPAGMEAGRYEVVIGVYERATGERIALQTLNPYATAADGPNALKLTEFDLPAR